MSFFNSKPWAKIPTDLLENKAMIRTEKELAPELRAAPVLLTWQEQQRPMKMAFLTSAMVKSLQLLSRQTSRKQFLLLHPQW